YAPPLIGVSRQVLVSLPYKQQCDNPTLALPPMLNYNYSNGVATHTTIVGVSTRLRLSQVHTPQAQPSFQPFRLAVLAIEVAQILDGRLLLTAAGHGSMASCRGQQSMQEGLMIVSLTPPWPTMLPTIPG